MKVLMAFCLLLLAAWLPLTGLAQTTKFTYQGQLTDSGPPQPTYQMRFRLFDGLAGGSQIGSNVENPAVAVDNGIFSVVLDFGANPFPGADRFLEIAVRRSGGESYTVLSPRQQIASSPYAIRTLSAQTADLAVNAQNLGGIPANQYLTNATVGSAFIKNDTVQQTANFNISGNGIFGGKIATGTPTPAAKLAVAGSGVYNAPDAARFDLFNTTYGGGFLQHVQDDGTWQLATTSAATRMVVSPAGSIGIGTPVPNANYRLDTVGYIRSLNNQSTGFVSETTGGTNSWARFYMRSPSQSWFMGTSQAFNGNQLYIADETAGQTRMVIATNGNVGIGTVNPATRMTLSGGVPWTAAGWTASMNMQNVSALGWEANASGQRFGIGQTNGGLYFFRTNSAFGNSASPANYDLVITDNGHLTQRLDAFGLPKAMIWVNTNRLINKCYNGITGVSASNAGQTACGFTVSVVDPFTTRIDFGFPVNTAFFALVVRGSNLGTGGVFTFGEDLRVNTNNQIVVAIGAESRAFQVIVY